jgi:hypothetical protein
MGIEEQCGMFCPYIFRYDKHAFYANLARDDRAACRLFPRTGVYHVNTKNMPEIRVLLTGSGSLPEGLYLMRPKWILLSCYETTALLTEECIKIATAADILRIMFRFQSPSTVNNHKVISLTN